MKSSQKIELFLENIAALEMEEKRPLVLEYKIPPALPQCVFYRIESLTYEKDFPRLEAFENVVASINKPQCRLVYYLRGTESGVEFYVGAVEDPNHKGELCKSDYGDMLKCSLQGNFLGSKLVECTNPVQENIMEHLNYSTVLGIPSRNKDKEDISFQGVDRLVNIMAGIDFHLMIVWEPVADEALHHFDNAVKDMYGDLQYIAKYSEQVSVQRSNQDGSSTSHADSESTSKTEGANTSRSKNEGWSKGTSTNEGKSGGTSSGDSYSGSNRGWSKGTGTNKGTSGGSSDTHGESTSDTKGTSKSNTKSTSKSETYGGSYSITSEVHNKKASEYIKYIDEELLPRLRQGKAKGMYRTAMYLASETKADLGLLENAVVSIYQGDSSTFSPLRVRPLPNTEAVRSLICSFSIYDQLTANADFLPLQSRPINRGHVSLGTWLTPSEISIMAGLPQKEVPGLELREQVGFGLNITSAIKPSDAKVAKESHDALHLGHMYQEGNLLKHRAVTLQRKDLDKHIFIAGTTGSGKTTTCHRLLHDAQMPFMVIEPAKTEYRALLNEREFSDILLFTVGNEKGVPFRFNPFEFLPEESLSAHVDLLKACFMASFDMEAAIPNLLEEALYKTYEGFGWVFRDDSNIYLEDRTEAWRCGGVYFPTISDYITTVSKVVEAKGFNERLRDDYLGSIKARLDSLRTGVKGLMLDTRLSVDFTDLIKRKVILELEELKSGEDKSFIMGLILGRLLEALKAEHKRNPDFKHITLVEEAHRLLSRPSAGSSPSRMLGVEMFTDMLAEVRKYGESLIIVDQIPSKLAPEVLKNTNTKIIHKIFSRDDKEAVGDAMALDEKQRNYLSHVATGEAIVFSQGWKKPIDVQVEMLENASTSHDVSEEMAFAQGWQYWMQYPEIYCPDCPEEMLEPVHRGRWSKELLQKMESIRARSLPIWDMASNLGERFALWQKVRQESQILLGEQSTIFLSNVLYNKSYAIQFSEKKSIFTDIDAFKGGQSTIKEYVRECIVSENCTIFEKSIKHMKNGV